MFLNLTPSFFRLKCSFPFEAQCSYEIVLIKRKACNERFPFGLFTAKIFLTNFPACLDLVSILSMKEDVVVYVHPPLQQSSKWQRTWTSCGRRAFLKIRSHRGDIPLLNIVTCSSHWAQLQLCWLLLPGPKNENFKKMKKMSPDIPTKLVKMQKWSN